MVENTYEFGITETGFNPKPIDYLEEDVKELLKQNFGSSVDLSQTSPLWRIIQITTVQCSQIWIQAEENFYNCFIQTADGVSLDLLGEDVGLTRKPAVYSGVELTIYKNTASVVTIPTNSLFQTVDGIVFLTDEEITIPSGDPSTTTGLVTATCSRAGLLGNVSAGTITLPTNTISGVDSSTNLSIAFGGKDKETDSEYRKRLRDYVRATWTQEAIRSAALNVDGVSNVKIIEAATSYECLVVPNVSFTTELKNAVEEAIEKVTAITVEFSVIEAEIVEIDVDATAILADTYDYDTAEQESGLEINEYIASLNIDDDVVKSKVIQAIMNVAGILNVYNLNLGAEVINERHTYVTGTDSYTLKYSTGVYVTSVVGLLSGSQHIFIEGVDYQFNSSPAVILWLSGDRPDNNTEFKVTYGYPPNGIGDIQINQDSIARFGEITLNSP